MTEFKLTRKFLSLKNRTYDIIPITGRLEIRIHYDYIQTNNCFLSLSGTTSFWSYILIDFDRLRKEFDQLDVISDFVEQDDTFLILKYGRKYLDVNIVSTMNKILKFDYDIDVFNNFLEYE